MSDEASATILYSKRGQYKQKGIMQWFSRLLENDKNASALQFVESDYPVAIVDQGHFSREPIEALYHRSYHPADTPSLQADMDHHHHHHHQDMSNLPAQFEREATIFDFHADRSRIIEMQLMGKGRDTDDEDEASEQTLINNNNDNNGNEEEFFNGIRPPSSTAIDGFTPIAPNGY
jgi:hypothetical protein